MSLWAALLPGALAVAAVSVKGLESLQA